MKMQSAQDFPLATMFHHGKPFCMCPMTGFFRLLPFENILISSSPQIDALSERLSPPAGTALEGATIMKAE